MSLWVVTCARAADVWHTAISMNHPGSVVARCRARRMRAARAARRTRPFMLVCNRMRMGCMTRLQAMARQCLMEPLGHPPQGTCLEGATRYARWPSPEWPGPGPRDPDHGAKHGGPVTANRDRPSESLLVPGSPVRGPGPVVWPSSTTAWPPPTPGVATGTARNRPLPSAGASSSVGCAPSPP